MMQKETKYVENVQHVLSLSYTDGKYLSPIDLNIQNKVDIELPDLQWNHYEERAQKMTIVNNGQKVVLNAEWKQEKPFISSGPLPFKYVFSQLHFHWGNNDNEGSEHSVEGHCLPMEVHAVHSDSLCSTQGNTHQEKTDLVVMVYLFVIQEKENKNLSPIIDALPSVCSPYSSTCIGPSPLEYYVKPFHSNYFLYWGSASTATCSHKILWFVCREPIGISRSQLCNFRKLQGPDHQLMAHPFNGVQSLQNRSLFLVNGATPLNKTLMPLVLTYHQVVREVSYTEEFWPFIHISSCSELQSPINISTQGVTHNHFPPLTFTDLLELQGHAYLNNIQRTAAVKVKGRSPLLEGGPLRGSYKFVELHFHWSLDDYAGSEHTLDGKSFSMESHAVHVHIRCENITEALEFENAIVVVGNFLQVSDSENKDFLPISSNLRKIQEHDSATEISSNCLSWLKYNGHDGYYTYPGSLTTSLQSKAVTWILYPEPIAVSSSQICGFRELRDNKALLIQRNCRNVQNLNNRKILFAV